MSHDAGIIAEFLSKCGVTPGTRTGVAREKMPAAENDICTK